MTRRKSSSSAAFNRLVDTLPSIEAVSVPGSSIYRDSIAMDDLGLVEIALGDFPWLEDRGEDSKRLAKHHELFEMNTAVEKLLISLRPPFDSRPLAPSWQHTPPKAIVTAKPA